MDNASDLSAAGSMNDDEEGGENMNRIIEMTPPAMNSYQNAYGSDQ